MIAQLKGTIAHKSPGYLILDVRGVGYEVIIPLSTFYNLPEEGNDLSLIIHTHVREDAIQLYGFLTAREKEIFQLLITVSGIGPRLAVNILSGIDAPGLAYAISRGDIHKLNNIPGVGKKTAERMIVELRDKVGAAVVTEIEKPPPSPMVDDLTSALLYLGYKKGIIDETLKRLRDEITPEATIEKLLKKSLKLLTG